MRRRDYFGVNRGLIFAGSGSFGSVIGCILSLATIITTVMTFVTLCIDTVQFDGSEITTGTYVVEDNSDVMVTPGKFIIGIEQTGLTDTQQLGSIIKVDAKQGVTGEENVSVEYRTCLESDYQDMGLEEADLTALKERSKSMYMICPADGKK